MAILAEGPSRLVAVDLRTGELRWRYRARAGAFRLRRVGRILLAVCGDGAVHALDVASGEPAWRFSESARFSLAPAVSRDVALAVSGDPAAAAGTLHGLDLYSGRELWRRELGGAPLAAPLGVDGVVCVPVAGATRTASSATLVALDPRDGATRWVAPEPGLGRGGVALAVDRALVVNAPGGRVTALDLADGSQRWTRELANAATDDVPRRLEPVLRNGGLFVPAAQIHALKPADGTSLGPALDSDLIPDVFRVDERGWLYVAEESGHLRAYAPAPALALVR
jgi:outer membrane protein assembly factor BamB